MCVPLHCQNIYWVSTNLKLFFIRKMAQKLINQSLKCLLGYSENWVLSISGFTGEKVKQQTILKLKQVLGPMITVS